MGIFEFQERLTADAKTAIPRRQDDLNRSFAKCKEKIEGMFQLYSEVLESVKRQTYIELEKKRDEQEQAYVTLYRTIDAKLTKLDDAVRLAEFNTV